MPMHDSLQLTYEDVNTGAMTITPSSVSLVYKNSSVDEIANVNFYAVRPEDT